MRPSITLSLLILTSQRALSLTKDDFSVDRKALGEVLEAFNEFDGNMFSGLMPTSKNESEWHESEFMFWLFEPKAPVAPDTLTLWFNGGPGCSSFHGGLFEIAPVSTAHYPAGYHETPLQPPLLRNQWAWTKATNIMLIEMPQGVGFSHGPMPDSEFDVGRDMYGFLSNFFNVFPEMRKKKLFLFGESYAGYYVPSIAHAIHQENLKAVRRDIINLAGIGLGNGWIEADTQGPAVIDFAWWHGLIDSNTKDSLHGVWNDCAARKKMSPPFHSFTVPDECGIMNAVLEAAGKGVYPASTFRSPNPYDVTTFDLYPVLFGSNSTMDIFYNNPKVKMALNAPADVIWEGCIPGAGRRRLTKKRAPLPGEILLAHDQPESVVPYIAELLDSDIQVLIYSGDRDLTTCAQGSEMALNKMDWKGKEEWLAADRGLWMVNDDVAGFSKELVGLQFVVVYNSGHLLPNSSPVQALDLITRFTTNQRFLDISLPRFDGPALKAPSEKITHRWSRPFHEPVTHLLFIVILAFGCFGLGYAVASKQLGVKEQYTQLE